MQITNLEWREDNISHIARHGVSPQEVEEVCFSHSSNMELGRRERQLYYVSGQTEAGRYLFVVLKYFGHGNAKVITARDMHEKERARYKRRK